MSEAERGRSERARRVAEATDLDAKAAWVTGPFRLAVLTMEQKLLMHAQVAFERNFSRYFATLIDDPALVARTDVAFTPAVAIEGEWTPAEALSGGERTSLALAFRLALAQVVRSLGSLRLDTILLDEPTDGFSPEQVVRMGELLDALALPQVIIVSHEDALAGIADRVVRVVKVDGRSKLLTGSSATPAPEAESEPTVAPRPRSDSPALSRPRSGLRRIPPRPREAAMRSRDSRRGARRSSVRSGDRASPCGPGELERGLGGRKPAAFRAGASELALKERNAREAGHAEAARGFEEGEPFLAD